MIGSTVDTVTAGVTRIATINATTACAVITAATTIGIEEIGAGGIGAVIGMMDTAAVSDVLITASKCAANRAGEIAEHDVRQGNVRSS